MNRETFNEQVFQNWAERYRCTPAVLHQPGIQLIPDPSFAGSGGIHVWHIAKRAIVRFDPDQQNVVEAALKVQGNPVALEPGALTATLTTMNIQVSRTEVGLLSYLYPPDFKPISAPAGFSLRRLVPGDAPALDALKAACGADEIEEAEVSVEDEIPFGCFAPDQLAAVATGFRLTGFMDIGVITHPDFRRQGLGRAGVSTLCAWCIERDILPQYRNAETNIPSHQLAIGLGFVTMIRSEHVYLASGATV